MSHVSRNLHFKKRCPAPACPSNLENPNLPDPLHWAYHGITIDEHSVTLDCCSCGLVHPASRDETIELRDTYVALTPILIHRF